MTSRGGGKGHLAGSEGSAVPQVWSRSWQVSAGPGLQPVSLWGGCVPEGKGRTWGPRRESGQLVSAPGPKSAEVASWGQAAQNRSAAWKDVSWALLVPNSVPTKPPGPG